MPEKFFKRYFLAFALLTTAIAQPSVSLGIGSTSGLPGGTVSLPITITLSGGAQPTAMQWALSVPAGLTLTTVDAGPSATNAGKQISCSASACVVFGLNTTTISSGTIAVANFQISA